MKQKFPYLFPAVMTLATCGAGHLDAAITASEDYSLIPNYGGTYLGQGNAAVNGSQAVLNNSCVPTSVANGLSYMQAYAYSTDTPSPFSSNPNQYAAVNALQTAMGTTASGTYPGPALTGLQSYFATVNLAPGVLTWQDTNPTAQTMANYLNSHDGVQLGILWGSVTGTTFTGGGGHFVSLTGLDLTDGSGTIDILDPWGNPIGNDADTSGAQKSLLVSSVNITAGLPAGTYFKVTFPNTDFSDPVYPAAGTAYAGGALTGIIAIDMVQAIPEPTAGSFVLITIALGSGLRRCRRA